MLFSIYYKVQLLKTWKEFLMTKKTASKQYTYKKNTWWQYMIMRSTLKQILIQTMWSIIQIRAAVFSDRVYRQIYEIFTSPRQYAFVLDNNSTNIQDLDIQQRFPKVRFTTRRRLPLLVCVVERVAIPHHASLVQDKSIYKYIIWYIITTRTVYMYSMCNYVYCKVSI